MNKEIINNQNMEIITKEFEGKGVEIILDENNEPLFELYSTGMALGYANKRVSKGKEYISPYKDRIDKVMKNGSITGLCQGVTTYLTEEMLYDFMLEAHTEKCRDFRKWVTSEILPSIRKHGAYISSNEESVNQDYIKYTYGQLKNTFINCPIENISETYEECMNFHRENKTRIPYAKNSKKRSDATHEETDSRIKIMQKIVVTLENRNLLLCESGKFGFVSEIDKVIKLIKDDIKKQHNLINRGVIANKTKKINQLQKEIDYHNPKFENFIECKTAPISNNAMYEAVSDWNTGKPTMVKSQKYKNWLYYFDDSKLNMFSDLDFSKPIIIHAKYIMSKNQDRSNFIKPLHDKIATYFEVDDRLFVSGTQECLGYYDDVRDGRIFLYLCNGKEEITDER